MENAKIYLCKADCSILGSIAGLKPETCSLKKSATDLWEFTFEVNRYIEEGGALVQSSYYDSIHEMMKLYFDIGEEQLFFMIDSEPVIRGEGIQETKTVTAHSIECELCNIYLNNFKINCGTSDSQEYLACETDENGIINYYNVNPYTGLPNEYISLVNYNNPQLSLLHLALQGTGWSVKPDIDPGICRIKRSCDIQSNNVYTFLMNVVSPSASIIFEFDRKHRQIGAVTMENYGEDTGIFVSMRNLVNSFEISSSSDDTMKTKIIPSGADNLGIEYVNFGSDYIINLDYFMNTVNEYGDYQYVSKELHDKYNLWKNYRETEKETFQDKQYTRRELYIELTKLYNQTLLDISELKNRVPNDGVVTDYKTFSLEELKLHLNAYNKALAALITIYKNEYGVTEDLGDAPGYMPTPSTATNIKDTPYWHDFYAYKESIIPQIKEALKMYCQTGSNGNLVTDNGYFIELEYGNPAYYADPSIVKEVDAYQYEWSLYGLEELEAKKKAWLEVSNLLFNECFIQSGTSVSPDAYRTPDDAGWNSLSDTQRKEFTSKSAYIDKLNQYLDYMSFDERDNSLTKTKCKGIIRQCDEAIILCKNKIASIENLQNEYQTQRKKLANSVDIENFKINDTLLFTEKDLNIIYSMIREQDYNNSNIVTTNLDDIVTSIDAQKELYQAAVEELYKLSRPQYSFSATIDNLYALEEFQCFHDDFKVGNFIRVGLELHEELCDANFIKLRVISITYNPILPDENLSVEFSTMTKSLAGLNDLDFLLSKSSSGGSSSGASSSSSGGTYGNNDANVQMSNNMLNALLSTELFGTAVTDVILDSIKGNKGNFNTLLAHSGVFDSLKVGNTAINGDCISAGSIKSQNWNGTKDDLLSNTEGSIIDLINGSFNFAGGQLKYENSELSVNGKITATNSVVTDSVIADIRATNLTAKSGEIAGWKFDESTNGFYEENKNIGIHGRKYIGTDNFILGDLFSLNNNGFILKDTWYKRKINNFSLTTDKLKKLNAPTNSFNRPERFYVYNYKSFDENLNFNLFIPCTAKVRITFHSVNDRAPDIEEIHILNGLVYKYTFQQKQIKNICDIESDDSKNSILTAYTNDELSPDNIGYIDFNSLTSPENNFDEVFDEDTQGFVWPVTGYDVEYYEIENFEYLFDIHQENKAIEDFENNKDGYGHIWEKTNGEPIELLGVCWSGAIYILSDIISSDEMILNSFQKKIKIDDTCMTDKGFSSKYMYDHVKVSGKPLYINADGTIGLSGSSMRFKNSISTKLTEISNPHGLYDIDIVQYKYNDDYFTSSHDGGIGKYFIGFVAENVAEKFKDGCTFDKDGTPDGWDIRYMFPAALKLIQEQHKEIETIKQQFEQLKKL